MLKTVLAGAAALSFVFAASAQAKTYDLTFTGANAVSGDVFLKTAGATSPFAVTDASGTITDAQAGAGGSFSINGLSGYAGADNLFFYPAAGSPAANVDFGGVSFTTTQGVQFNIGGGGSGPSGLVLNDSNNNPGGYPGVLGSNNITLSVSAVPEPGVWAMMLMGVALMGASLRFSRKRDLAALTA